MWHICLVGLSPLAIISWRGHESWPRPEKGYAPAVEERSFDPMMKSFIIAISFLPKYTL